MNQERLTRWLAMCGLAAPLVLVSFMLAAGFVTPGYSHLAHTVSQLGAQGQPYPWIIGTGLFLYGLLVIAGGFGFHRVLGGSTMSKVLCVALSAHGVSVLLAGILRDYPADTDYPVTFADDLHGYLAYIAFVTIVTGMIAFAVAANRRDGWSHLTPLTMAAAILAIGLVSLFFVEPLRPVQGLIQRTFYMFPLLWLALASLQAFNVSLQREVSKGYVPRTRNAFAVFETSLEPSSSERARRPMQRRAE